MTEGPRVPRSDDGPLVIDLYAAKIPRDKIPLLLGLGSAALEEDASAIRLYAHDESADVRAAVANSLRRLDSSDIRKTLLGLLADERIDVQQQALSSLDRRDPTADDLDEIRAIVESGKLRRDLAQGLVNYLAHHRNAGPGVDAVLDAMAKRPDFDAETLSRVERVRRGGA
jgi:hypothetical protein